MRKFFVDNSVDLVYVAGGAWQYKPVIAAKLAGKKVVWHHNDTYLPTVFRLFYSLLSPLADGYIYASESTRKYYSPIGSKGRPEFVIPASVDTDFFDPSCRFNSDYKPIKKMDNSIVVGTVCNINPIKGIETLVKVASHIGQLDKVSSDLIFVVVGPVHESQYDYFRSIRKMCSNFNISNIVFAGAVEDVRSYLSRFDIYICTSISESSPISIWEAMSMAKPIVSTNVGDVPLYVQNDITGFIADVNDYVSLSKYVHYLSSSELLRVTLGKNARKVAIEKLDSNICANRHIDAFDMLLKNNL